MLSEWSLIGVFYDGLSEISKISLDSSAGGSLHLKKMPAETRELIEMVVNNQFMYTSERNPVNHGASQKKEVHEVETLNTILAQNKILTQQVNMIDNENYCVVQNQSKQASIHW